MNYFQGEETSARRPARTIYSEKISVGKSYVRFTRSILGSRRGTSNSRRSLLVPVPDVELAAKLLIWNYCRRSDKTDYDTSRTPMVYCE